MKRMFYSILMPYVIFTLLSGCSYKDNSNNKQIVAEINKYKMTVEDLKYELKNMPYGEEELLKTEEGRKQYLDRLIEREILIQEAQAQGIDREKDFMKSIENYWEQALLKLLLERKAKEISGLIYVYDNEIEEYYKNSGENLPLSKVRNEIKNIIRQNKETQSMELWINQLKNKAYIRVNEDVLNGLIKEEL